MNFFHFDKMATRLTTWIGSASSLLVHTVMFVACFVLGFLGVKWEAILLVLTTVVSLEAIYLAIFIQMTVNRTSQSLQEVEEDIDEIQKDVDEIQKDVDEIQEDVGEISEDEKKENEERAALDAIKAALQNVMADLEKMKKNNK